MLYTRENIGHIKKKNTESEELEANKKIDKIIKQYNTITSSTKFQNGLKI